MNDLVAVANPNTRMEAEIIKGKLASVGIASYILADDAGGMYPFPFQSGFSGVLVMVTRSDSKRAKKLLSEKK